MEFNIYIYVAIALILALLISKVMNKIKLPNVTGYLIIGLIAGPSILNLINNETIEILSFIPEVALGFIAFSIGAEFRFSFLKKIGKAPLIIGLTEAFGAVLLVDLALILSGESVPFSIVLGSIAAATAPAATLMVVRQYRAKGPVTDTLLPVVAVDDAYAIMLFGISVAIANAINSGNTSITMMLVNPLIEIIGAIVLGAILGFIVKLLTDWFSGRGNQLSIIVGAILLGIGLANMIGFSALLVCMALSVVYVNTSRVSEQVFEQIDRVTPPLFMLFFFLSGAGLNLSILPTVGKVGIIYIVVRVIGKVLGAAIGCQITRSEPVVKKYLGLTLIPQAGVAIGLITVAGKVVPNYAEEIEAVILSGTVIYELIGPLVTKFALKKAGEIKENKKSENILQAQN